MQAADDNNFYPGWQVASSSDFEAVKNLLSVNNELRPQNKLFAGWLSGFEAQNIGKYHWVCWHINYLGYHKDYQDEHFIIDQKQTEAYFMCSDKMFCFIKADKDFKTVKTSEIWEKPDLVGNKAQTFLGTRDNDFYCMPIRLVEK